MNNKRFNNIDYCKCIALLLVLVYHYWVLSGSFEVSSIPGMQTIISLGGEIGVTMFFVLSGFGIYCLLRRKDSINWITFIKSRYKKIAPLYYFSLVLVIAITPVGAGYLSKDGSFDIITHVLFIHNFNIKFHGSINSALWTMGVIFQYYLIAPFLYKCMVKNKYITVLTSIAFTIGMKVITYKYILPLCGMSGSQYFIYGRQLFTALDNFVVGMFVGSIVCENEKKISKIKGIICFFSAIILLVCWGNVGLTHGVYIANFSSYLWHSVLALIVAGIVAVFGVTAEINCLQFVRVIGKNEYGIYLLHFPILQNLLQSQLVSQCNAQGQYIIGGCIFLIIALPIGFIFNGVTEIFDRGNKVWK